MKFSFPQLKLNKHTWFAILAVVVLALAASFFFFRKDSPQAEASWWDEGWYYRKALVVDYTKVDEELSDFPVAVQFNTTNNIYNNTNSDGSDLRFTDNNGNILKYEIEKWNESGTSTVWVKLPTVYATASTTFYIYYGNPTATDAQTPTEVWDDNFVMVQHLNNTATGTDSFVDSTKYNNHGTGYDEGNSLQATNSGIIDGAFDFDGNDDHVRVPNDSSLSGMNQLTMSAWVYFDQLPTSVAHDVEVMVKRHTTDPWNSYYFDIVGTACTNDNVMYVSLKNQSEAAEYRCASSSLTASQWYYIAATWDGSDLHFYLNGINDDEGATNFAGDSIFSSDGTLYINGDDSGPGRMDGKIDDVRISKIARPAAWLKADYYNGVNTLVTQSSEEKGPGPVAYWSFDEGYGTTANDYSTGGNHGAISGATWKDSYECIKGKCLYFDGSNDVVTISNTTNITSYNESLTVSLWFKTNHLGAQRGIMTTGDVVLEDSPYWLLGYSYSTDVPYVIHAGYREGTTILEKNKWYHLVYTYNSSDQSGVLYLDGRVENTFTASAHDNDKANIFIGGGWEGYFKGFIDEVKVYNYARSADQVKQDYNKGLSVSLGNANPYASLSDGLIGWWKMDEASWNGTSNEVIDHSGNANHGTAGGGANTTSTAQFARAGYFDGDNDVVTLADNDNTDLSEAITISAWVRQTTTGGWDYVVSRGYFDNAYSFGIYSTNLIAYINGNMFWDQSTVLATNQWYHIAFTYDRQATSDNVKLYLNGVNISRWNYSQPIETHSNFDTFIGADYNLSSSYNFNGMIDEVRMYNRALSSDEVRRLSEWAPPPVLYMPLDENEGTLVYNIAANPNAISAKIATGTLEASMNKNNWVQGKYGSALKFDGVDDWVDIGGTAYASLLFDNQTLQFWFNPSIDLNNNGITRLFDGNYFGIYYDSTTHGGLDNTLFGYVRDSSGTFRGASSDATVFKANTWYHVAVTFSGNNVYLYVNGIRQTNSNSSYTGIIGETADEVGFGASRSGGDNFSGIIDDIKIYNYARNQRQILEDMNAGRQNNPIGYWSFDEGQGSYANDYSGYNHRATFGCSGSGCSLPEWKTGVRNSAMYSDPATSTEKQCVSLTTTNLSISSATGTPVSMSVWLNASTTQISSGGGWVLRRGSGTDENYSMILVASGGKYKVKLEGYDGITFRSGTSNGAYITPGEWTHVVMIYKQGIGFDLYINGEFKERVNYPYINLTGSSFQIACGGGSNQSYNGYIDELKIYLYDLTMDEIRKDYNFGLQNVLSQPAVNTQSVPTSSLAHWKFDDMSGTTAVDSSGNGNNGNISGSPSWTVEGKKGGALSFNGSSDYISVTNNANLNFGTSSFSVSYWTKSNYPSGTRGFIQKGGGPFNNAGTGWQMRQNGTLFEFARNNGGASPTRLSTSLSTWSGKWVNVIVTYNYSSGDAKLYVDGSYIGSVNYTGDYVDSYTLDIGRGNDGYFNGLLDDVKIYNYVLSDRDVAIEYNGGAPVGYWKFDEGEGSVAKDYSGAGNHGTLVVGSGGTQSATSSAWANGQAGKINGSLNFDGTDDEVILPGPVLSNNATIAGWFYWIGGTTSLLRDNTGGGGWILGFSSGSTLRYRVGGTEFNTNMNVSDLQNKWVHYAVTKNGANSSYYIDGSLVYSGTSAGNTTSTMPWHLMKNGSLSSYISGKSDEVKIWNYPLTPEEIKKEYNGGFSSFFR